MLHNQGETTDHYRLPGWDNSVMLDNQEETTQQYWTINMKNLISIWLPSGDNSKRKQLSSILQSRGGNSVVLHNRGKITQQYKTVERTQLNSIGLSREDNLVLLSNKEETIHTYWAVKNRKIYRIEILTTICKNIRHRRRQAVASFSILKGRNHLLPKGMSKREVASVATGDTTTVLQRVY